MNLQNTYRKGFTLIELLVVISIIGMLSSIVLASLNSAREKARLAAAKAFAASLHNRLGAYPVTLYDFNEGSNSLVDLSGNTSGTTLAGTGNSWVTGIEGQAIQLPGNDANYAEVLMPSSRPLQATYSIWFNPATLSGDMTMASFLASLESPGHLPENAVHVRGRMYVNSNSQPVFLVMSYIAYPAVYSVSITSNTAVKAGTWNHLAVSIDYSNGMDVKMYLNGKLVGTGRYGTNGINEFAYTWIGRRKGASPYTSWNGALDAFRAYEGLVQ